jgi:hypothetical protein
VGKEPDHRIGRNDGHVHNWVLGSTAQGDIGMVHHQVPRTYRQENLNKQQKKIPRNRSSNMEVCPRLTTTLSVYLLVPSLGGYYTRV